MMRPEQSHLVLQWVDKAEEDYKNAEYVLGLKEDCPVGTVCFHSQQGVEKYLKALLVCHALPVPKSHDLVELSNRIPLGQRPELPKEGLALLNRYAVEARYPGDWDVITRDEAERALDTAQTIRSIISQKIVRMMTPD